MAKKLEITLKHSVVGRPESQRVTVRTLGLRKTYQTVIQEDNPSIRGMISKVSHLLAVRELND